MTQYTDSLTVSLLMGSVLAVLSPVSTAAQGVTGPTPAVPRGNPGEWVTTEDYPARALREEREGTTAFKLDVSPDGTPVACTVTQSSGHADLDARTCETIMERARFKEARDPKGKAVAGTYSSRVRWQIPEGGASDAIAELGAYPREPFTYMVNPDRVMRQSYPAAALTERREGTVRVNYLIDAKGEPTNCTVTESSGHADLDAATCPMLKANQTQFPALDVDGRPVAGRLDLSVKWTLPTGDGSSSDLEFLPTIKPDQRGLELQYDATGRMTGCKLIGRPPPGLDELELCARSGFYVAIEPAVNAAGKPVGQRVRVMNVIETLPDE